MPVVLLIKGIRIDVVAYRTFATTFPDSLSIITINLLPQPMNNR